MSLIQVGLIRKSFKNCIVGVSLGIGLESIPVASSIENYISNAKVMGFLFTWNTLINYLYHKCTKSKCNIKLENMKYTVCLQHHGKVVSHPHTNQAKPCMAESLLLNSINTKNINVSWQFCNF